MPCRIDALHVRLSRARSLSLSFFVCEKKANRRQVVRLDTRAYGTSDTAALHIHSNDLKNSTDRLTERETLKRLVSVFGVAIYLC